MNQLYETAIREILGKTGRITREDGILCIHPPEEMYAEWHISFNRLQRLSKLFKTTGINLKYDAGWGGTEATGGDPAKFVIEIKLRTDA